MKVSPLDISITTVEEFRSSVLVFYTGLTRSSSEILETQRQDTERGDAAVVESLHHTKEVGYRIKEALEAGDLERFGLLLDEHWENKKRRSSRISDAALDRLYETAKSCGGLPTGANDAAAMLGHQRLVRREHPSVASPGERALATEERPPVSLRRLDQFRGSAALAREVECDAIEQHSRLAGGRERREISGPHDEVARGRGRSQDLRRRGREQNGWARFEAAAETLALERERELILTSGELVGVDVEARPRAQHRTLLERVGDS